MHEKKDQMTQECVNACTNCASVCRETIAHCLTMSEEHKESYHITTLMDCVRTCEVSVDLMDRNSKYSQDMCNLCAKVCQDCAKSCEQFDDPVMKNCAKVCRDCSEKCKKMAKK